MIARIAVLAGGRAEELLRRQCFDRVIGFLILCEELRKHQSTMPVPRDCSPRTSNLLFLGLLAWRALSHEQIALKKAVRKYEPRQRTHGLGVERAISCGTKWIGTHTLLLCIYIYIYIYMCICCVHTPASFHCRSTGAPSVTKKVSAEKSVSNSFVLSWSTM